jgi:hypothetical protein
MDCRRRFPEKALHIGFRRSLTKKHCVIVYIGQVLALLFGESSRHSTASRSVRDPSAQAWWEIFSIPSNELRKESYSRKLTFNWCTARGSIRPKEEVGWALAHWETPP